MCLSNIYSGTMYAVLFKIADGELPLDKIDRYSQSGQPKGYITP